MKNKVLLWSILFLLFTLGGETLQAQLTTATLSGTVRDASGAAIKGAEVTATNIGTSLARTTKASDEGEYRIEFLPIGSYTVEISAHGFSKFVQKGIVLQINQSARLDATLRPGEVKEVIEVTSAAPLVNTNSAEIGQTVENVQIQELPLVNRNVYTLLDITPGVQSNSTTGLTLGYPEQKTLINGGSDGNYTGTVNYFLDGGTNMTGLRNTGNVLPNPDAIQEFRVQTNAYSAEYGRFANGVVNVVTKSGTNDYHGSAFEFWRNDALNAKPWLATKRSPLHRNQFGGTFGGAIIKDKTFFFGSYAGLRQITSSLLQSIVPTDLERAGDFTASKSKPTDPTNKNAAFKCNNVTNVICQNLMDPVALKILDTYIPKANQTPTASNPNNYQGYLQSPYDTNEYLIKVDHQLTSKDQITGSMFTTAGSNTINGGGSNVPWSRQQFTWRQTNVNLSDTHTISPSMVNQTWIVYSRMFGGRLNVPGISLADLGSKFAIQGTPSLPQITISGYFTLGSAIAGPVAGTNLYSIRDVFSWSKGHHNIRLGGEVSLEKDIQQTLLNNYGQFTFDTGYNKNAFAAFLLGMPSKVTQDQPVAPATSTFNNAVFVQDDFRVSPRLTLNLGLRWDVQTAPKDSSDLQSTYIPGQKSTVRPDAPVGLVFPGDKGVPRGIVPTRLGHFSPRLGFAFDPFGDGKTSIRGAAGLFWGSISGNEWNQSSNYQPFATRLTFTNTGTFDKTTGAYTGATLTDPYRNYVGGNPFPYNGQYTNGGSTLGVSPGFDWPYTYQLNFSVQHQVTNDMSASVAYVGSITHNLPFSEDVNFPVLDGTSTTSGTNIQARRPNQSFGSIFLTTSNQASWYHSLQITAVKKMSHNVNFTSSYVWSKTMCTAQVQGGATGIAQNMAALWEDRGACDSDVRHAFNLAVVYQPDYYHGGNKLLNQVVNGWQLSPVLRIRTGTPFSVMNGLDANMDGTSNDRAQLVGNAYLIDRTANQWFNIDAFAQNPVKAATATTVAVPVDGNSPRNFLYGPSAEYLDLAISRNFKFSERFKLQFRGEATNVLNKVNLNNPNANIANKTYTNGVYTGTFGKITGAGSMRQLQLGLRLSF
jgi:hypothetical protein